MGFHFQDDFQVHQVLESFEKLLNSFVLSLSLPLSLPLPSSLPSSCPSFLPPSHPPPFLLFLPPSTLPLSLSFLLPPSLITAYWVYSQACGGWRRRADSRIDNKFMFVITSVIYSSFNYNNTTNIIYYLLQYVKKILYITKSRAVKLSYSGTVTVTPRNDTVTGVLSISNDELCAPAE